MPFVSTKIDVRDNNKNDLKSSFCYAYWEYTNDKLYMNGTLEKSVFAKFYILHPFNGAI